jgi:hypothetical protein
MASEVDICNISLGNLGDNATVASLDPPEGSAQAEHCARFYPIARDALLELHDWNFATKRALLAQVDNPWNQWGYAYLQPADCLRVIAVLDKNAQGDQSVALPAPYSQSHLANTGIGMYTPVDFVCETNDAGDEVIYTDQIDAMARYVAFVTDTTKFSPLFTTTLTWKLSALLAGPVLKGEAGRAESKRCEAMASAWLSKAVDTDVRQRKVQTTQAVPWMAGR